MFPLLKSWGHFPIPIKILSPYKRNGSENSNCLRHYAPANGKEGELGAKSAKQGRINGYVLGDIA